MTTVIQSHSLFGLAIWGSTFPCDAQKQLQIRQNYVIRTIVGRGKYDNITSHTKIL